MARNGIQYTDVKQAAIKLLSQGTSPSVQKIRDTLGTGSNSTIAEHLKVWREEYTTKEIYYLPANMPKELTSAFEVLWQVAMEQAENQLVSIKEDLLEQQQKWQQEKAIVEQAMIELKNFLSETQQKVEEKTTKIQSLQTELALAQERAANQSEELNRVKNQYEARLKRAFDDKDTALEKSANQQAELTQLQRQLSEQTEKHQTALTQERTLQAESENRWVKLIDQARTETIQLRKEYEPIINKQKIQIETLKNTVITFQNENTTKSAELKHTNTIIIELKEQINRLQIQQNEATASMTVLKIKLEESQKKQLIKKEKSYA